MAKTIDGVDSIANIPTGTVRDNLRATMVMGLPEIDTERPTFFFEDDKTYTREDLEGSPWDWTATPVVSVVKGSVQVLCAYQYFSPLGRQGAFYTEVGEFNPTTLVISMFEEEFNSVFGFDYVTVGPDDTRWHFRTWKPAVSLNDLTLYEVHTAATGAE
jgi:hypothetical protein